LLQAEIIEETSQLSPIINTCYAGKPEVDYQYEFEKLTNLLQFSEQIYPSRKAKNLSCKNFANQILIYSYIDYSSKRVKMEADGFYT
jgi:hypothetical protein